MTLSSEAIIGWDVDLKNPTASNILYAATWAMIVKGAMSEPSDSVVFLIV